MIAAGIISGTIKTLLTMGFILGILVAAVVYAIVRKRGN